MAIRTLPVKELLGLGFDVMWATLIVVIVGGGLSYVGIYNLTTENEVIGVIFLAIGAVILLTGMIGVQIKLITDGVSAAIYLNTDLLNADKKRVKDTHVFPGGFENLARK